MSFVKVTNHKDIPFSTETTRDDYYKYVSMEDLGQHCTINKHEVLKCRTIGILHSHCGKYMLTTLQNPEVKNSIRVTLKYLKELPPSAVVPYPVQIFGYLQYNEQPVLLPTLIQVLTVPMALRIDNSLQHVQRLVASRPKCDITSHDLGDHNLDQLGP